MEDRCAFWSTARLLVEAVLGLDEEKNFVRGCLVSVEPEVGVPMSALSGLSTKISLANELPVLPSPILLFSGPPSPVVGKVNSPCSQLCNKAPVSMDLSLPPL